MDCPCIADCKKTKCLIQPIYCAQIQLLILGVYGQVEPYVYIKSKNLDTVYQVIGKSDLEDNIFLQMNSNWFLNTVSDGFTIWMSLTGPDNPLTWQIDSVDVNCIQISFENMQSEGVSICPELQTVQLAE